MKRGIAVPVVLAFIIAMASFGMFIFHTMRQQNRQNLTNFNQLQAQFIARAGMEHALLKVKFLQRELYDAACLAQGRNPLFDFSKKIDITINPGPIFLYHRGDANPASDGFFTPDLDKIFAQCTNFPKHWLNSFMADLCSGAELSLGPGIKKKVNGILSMDPLPEEIRSHISEPFKSARYAVTDLNVVAQETSDDKEKVSNQMVVEIVVKADLTSAVNEKWSWNLKRTVRISRDTRF